MSEITTKPPEAALPDDGAGVLFDGVLARGPVRAATSDVAWLQAMLDFEAALARAEAAVGLFSVEDAQAIARACRVEDFDIAALGREAAATGNPVPALVRALTVAVSGSAAQHVHRGATSQDVIDTAAMLVAHRALGPLLEDLEGAVHGAVALAKKHRTTLMVGRTLMQHALPITFGLEAAAWLNGLDDAADRLKILRRDRLAVQLGGAAGTLAALGDAGPAVIAALAAELSLATPALPWHAVRTRIGELAGALGVAAGAIGKTARDVILLASTDVGEAREGGADRGGSSTMPHKQNPVAAISAAACTAGAPHLVAALLASMPQEHQRAAGAWHAEVRPFNQLLVSVGSGAAWLRDCLQHLTVDDARMRANLDATGGAILAERVADALASRLPAGRLGAQQLVREASAAALASGQRLADELKRRPAITAHLDAAEIDRLLDPASYLGSAALFIDRAIITHAARHHAAARDDDGPPGHSPSHADSHPPPPAAPSPRSDTRGRPRS